jgi:hypothetical protein
MWRLQYGKNILLKVNFMHSNFHFNIFSCYAQYYHISFKENTCTECWAWAIVRPPFQWKLPLPLCIRFQLPAKFTLPIVHYSYCAVQIQTILPQSSVNYTSTLLTEPVKQQISKKLARRRVRVQI